MLGEATQFPGYVSCLSSAQAELANWPSNRDPGYLVFVTHDSTSSVKTITEHSGTPAPLASRTIAGISN